MASVKKNKPDLSAAPPRATAEVSNNPFEKARAPLPVPLSAREIQASVVGRLESLVKGDFASALDPAFQALWGEVVLLADRYQEEIGKSAGRVVACAPGCSSCCHHWVEDVNSFEAETIAWWLDRYARPGIDAVIDRCNRDGAALAQLNALVEAKLAMLEPGEAGEEIDPTDLLLASFYRLRKPCPLLDKSGRACLVYPVRPLTCRMYVSFSDPLKCAPGFADDRDIPTYLFDLEEEADALIDALHFKYLKFEGDTGLRSLLVKYLTQRMS